MFGDVLCYSALHNTTYADVACRYISIYGVWPGSQWRGGNVVRSVCDVMTHIVGTFLPALHCENRQTFFSLPISRARLKPHSYGMFFCFPAPFNNHYSA